MFSIFWLSFKIDSNLFDYRVWVFTLVVGVIILLLARKFWFGGSVVIVAALLFIVFFIFGISLTSLSQPSRGSVAAVKGNLAGIRVQAELYKNKHDGLYGIVNLPIKSCPEEGVVYENLFDDKTIQNALKAVRSANRQLGTLCVFDARNNSWAVSAHLPQKSNISWYWDIWYLVTPLEQPFDEVYWCVDSTGASKQVSHHITEAKCPQ